MLRELIDIFSSDEPVEEMERQFSKMLRVANEMVLAGGEIYFDGAGAEEQKAVFKRDIKVNKLERKIRKMVTVHLAMHGNKGDLGFCLVLMSLVKDVERIGDHATNLAEVRTFYSEKLPGDEIVGTLRKVRKEVEDMLAITYDAFEEANRQRAVELITASRKTQQVCDELIVKVSQSEYSAADATAVTLGCRYYKRISGHLHNVMSSVVMPVHKIDFYDEKELGER